MEADEFVKAVDEADFEFLMKEKLDDFLEFVRGMLKEGEDRVVIRCALESDDDETCFPYYVWLVYSIFVNEEYLGLKAKEVYVPREEELASYYKVPDNLRGTKFYPLVIQ